MRWLIVLLGLWSCLVLANVSLQQERSLALLQNYIHAYDNQGSLCPDPRDKAIKSQLTQAYKIYYQQALAGDPMAAYDVGAANLYNLGIKGNWGDLNEASRWLKTAAEQGNVVAMRQLGIMFLEGETDTKKEVRTNNDIIIAQIHAIYWLKQAANYNDVQSLLLLTYLYHEGEKTSYLKKDDAKAFYYAQLAAKQNNARGYITMGDFYFSGYFVKRDYKQALNYYIQAVSIEGVPFLAKKFYFQRIAYMYSNGLGTPVDLKKAVYWQAKYEELIKQPYCPFRV